MQIIDLFQMGSIMSAVYIVAGQSNANNAFDEIRAALLERDPDCHVIRIAAPGAPLTWTREGLDWYSTDEMAKSLVGQVADIMRVDTNAEMSGVIWIQGEADTLAVARPENYADRLENLFIDFTRDLRAALPDRANDIDDFPLLVVVLSSFCPAATDRGNWIDLQKAQLDFGANWETSRLVNMDMLAALAGIPVGQMFKDDLHYSNQLTEVLGVAVANWLIEGRGYLTSAIGQGMVIGTPGNDMLGGFAARTDLKHGDGLTARVLVGQGGDDIFYINSPRTLVVELADGGWDKVFAACDFDLSVMGHGVEELSTIGSRGRTLRGNDLVNVLNGGLGNDQVFGGKGPDVMAGGPGADRLDGGAGVDRADYSAAESGVRVNLQQPKDNTGIAKGDRFVSIENLSGTRHGDVLSGNGGDNSLWAFGGNDSARGLGGDDTLRGGDGRDKLWGGGGDDVLRGGEGDDLLRGGAGKDTIVGGKGKDVLFGGLGKDVFIFEESLGKAHADRIADFSARVDQIWLNDSVFGYLGKGGLPARAFLVGDVATTAEHRIIYDPETGTILYDADGNGRIRAVSIAFVEPETVLGTVDFLIV